MMFLAFIGDFIYQLDVGQRISQLDMDVARSLAS